MLQVQLHSITNYEGNLI